jgi:hypothetical protein
MGAREVVLAGAAEHDAVAGLGGGALEPEVADAAVALGLRDVGESGLQVDVVQRALRHARLPAASATPAATDAHGEMQSSTEESCGECEDRSSASEKHCLPSSSSEPSSAQRPAPRHARRRRSPIARLRSPSPPKKQTYEISCSENGKGSLNLLWHVTPTRANWEGSKQELNAESAHQEPKRRRHSSMRPVTRSSAARKIQSC